LCPLLIQEKDEGIVMANKLDTLGTNHYATVEEAFAHRAKVAKFDAWIMSLTPAERKEFFDINGNDHYED
jgi:hypothetical protein